MLLDSKRREYITSSLSSSLQPIAAKSVASSKTMRLIVFIVLYQVFSFDVTGRSGTGPLRPDVCYSGSDTLTIPLSRSEPVLEMV